MNEIRKWKVAIVGNRDFRNKSLVFNFVKQLPENTIVISGGAIGPDSWAEYAAERCGLETDIRDIEGIRDGMPKDEFTKKAYERNMKIAEECDILVAFICRDAGGSNWTAGYARHLGKPVLVVDERQQQAFQEKVFA